MSIQRKTCPTCSNNLEVHADGSYRCNSCGTSESRIFEYSPNPTIRFFDASISKTFEYFQDIKSYERRYKHYCQRIDIISKSDHFLKTKEFWNLSLDIHREHLVLEIEYTFNPLEKISYKIVGEDSELKENYIYFQDLGTGTMTTGEIPPLMIISSPPNNRESEQYQQMLYYCKTQDRIHLENRQLGYEVGQLCSKCKKGKLRPSGHRKRHVRTEIKSVS